MVKTHYVYKITNKQVGVYYIGVRTGRVESPLDDLGHIYFTSGSLREDFSNHPYNYEQEIIRQFPTRKDALTFEQRLIARHINNVLCANKNVDKKAVKEAQRAGKYKKKTKKPKVKISKSVADYDASHITFEPKQGRSDLIWIDETQSFVHNHGDNKVKSRAAELEYKYGKRPY
jgi:hypothetical protein